VRREREQQGEIACSEQDFLTGAPDLVPALVDGQIPKVHQRQLLLVPVR